MAVIGKIRSKSGLLIGVIGVAMVLFVGGEFLNGGTNIFTKPDTSVGTINGVDISHEEFSNRVNEVASQQNITSDQMDQVRERVWSQLQQEYLVKAEYEKLGIQVTPEELFEEIKNNPRNPILVQYFTNPQTRQVYEQMQDEITGELSSQKVITYVKQLLSDENNAKSWKPVEDAIRNNMLSTKYNKALQEGLYVSNFDAEQKSNEDNKRVNISFAGMSYDQVSDEEITVEESDLKAYYNAHKNEKEYEQKETNRGIKVAIWTVSPSEEDVRATEKAASDLIEGLKATDNDTMFVLQNSDNPNAGFRTVGRYDLPAEVDSILFAGDSGMVFGPYMSANSYHITKKIGGLMESDSVRARHILIQPSETLDSAAARVKIDSIKAAIKAGADFAKLAEELSADLGSAKNGGDLDWFTQGRMVPEFNDACFTGKVGDMPIVSTQFGFHLIEITDKTAEKEKMRIATVSKEIRASDKTFDDAYNVANEFAYGNKTTEAFEAAVNDNPAIQVQDFDLIKEGDKTLGGFENPRQLINWVYSSEPGQVSEVYELGNQMVVATLTSIKNKGQLPFEEVKDRIEQKVKNEKKAEYILAKINGASDVDGVASALGSNVENAAALNFSSFSVPGIGPDTKILGTAFALNEGEQSPVITGENGVYIIRIDKVVPADENANLDMIKDQNRRTLAGRVNYEVFEALKQKGGVDDRRHKFF